MAILTTALGACADSPTLVTARPAAARSLASSMSTVMLNVSGSGTGNGTVTSSPAGITCYVTAGSLGGTCWGSYASNTLVTLTPTAANGSDFLGWNGACSGRGACQVTLAQSQNATATFLSRADTYVTTDITITTSANYTLPAPSVDPITGQSSFQVSAPPLEAHVVASYTPAGVPTIRTEFNDLQPDPTRLAAPQVVAADVTDDVLTEINPTNYALVDPIVPEAGGVSPMEIAGSTLNGSILASVLVDINETLVVGAVRAPDAVGGTSRIPPSARSAFARALVALEAGGGAQRAVWNGVPVTMELRGRDRLVMTDDESGALSGSARGLRALSAEATGKHERTFVRATEDETGRGARDDDPTGPAKANNGRGNPTDKKLWVLDEDRIEADEVNAGRRVQQTHVMRYREVRWFRNAARDAEREGAAHDRLDPARARQDGSGYRVGARRPRSWYARGTARVARAPARRPRAEPALRV